MQALKLIFGTNISSAIIFIFFGLIIFLALFLLRKMEEVKNKDAKINDLTGSLNTMDEQARLIVKTDLELSHIQEELDRKIKSLFALQRLSEILNRYLGEEIFSKINENIVNDLGFDLLAVFIKEGDRVVLKAAVGLRQPEDLFQFEELSNKKDILSFLSDRRIVGDGFSAEGFEHFHDYIRSKLGVKSFVLSLVQGKEGILGFVLLARYIKTEFFEGTREIVEILSAHIAQAVDNIRLFEELYSSKKSLEDKIKERTMDLEKALKEVEKSSRLKSEFVSAVSHEFRTPLTSIKGYASLLMQEKFGKMPEDVKLRLERIDQQSDSLVNMINDLLDISRIESGRIEISFQKSNLSEIIKRVGENLYPQISGKKIELRYGLPDKLILDIDRKLMERVITNLLSNAVKFTPEGKKIIITASLSGEKAVVHIKDEGIGIRTEDLDNVFKEFYRTDAAVKKGVKGTGLGLSLAKNIINAHKGNIKVKSRLGEGADFIFTLPVGHK